MEYKRIVEKVREIRGGSEFVRIGSRAIPIVLGGMYFYFGVKAVKRGKWVRYFLIPAGKFLLATGMRAAINAPRPYEEEDFEPILRGREGKSFPSRHAASGFIIARAVMEENRKAGKAALGLAGALGALRVLSGDHHVKDVLSGAAFYFCWGKKAGT